MMIMNATIREVREESLLVCDYATGQDVVVNTREACCFCVGQRIRIQYNGIMTLSMPPQISACCIMPAGFC